MGKLIRTIAAQLPILLVALLGPVLLPAHSHGQGALDAPRAFRWYYQYPPAGWRYWSRTASGWIERYPDGRENRFRTLGTVVIDGGCNAILALKLPGPTGEPATQVAIPTRGCDRHVLVFRFVGPPVSEWKVIGDMVAIEY